MPSIAPLTFFLILILSLPGGALAQDNLDATPFLYRNQLPDGVQYLPPPPQTDSDDFVDDWIGYQWGKSMRTTPRGEMAIRDADYHTDVIAKGFSPAFGMDISQENTPQIYTLLSRTIETGKQAVRTTKKFYSRKRPYVEFDEPTLVPEHELFNRISGSYPSGHTAMGWSAALVLLEIHPQAAEAILKRGYEYGESRIIAGYHYRSDVHAGRMAASAAVARLHADPGFLDQMQKAKDEFLRLSPSKNKNILSKTPHQKQ